MAMGKALATFYEGSWHDANTPILGAADHGAWQGTMVFDGARYFDGVTPDLDRHSQRIIRSAASMGMDAPTSAEEIEALIREGIKRFAPGEALYLRPMIWSREPLPSLIEADPTSSAFAICIETLPMPGPGDYSLTVSPYRRPRQDTALTEAKAACLYPNNARIITDARARGFNNALSLDLEDNVAETAATNVFMVRNGEVFTPLPNGTFLNGITRQRIMGLLKADGYKVHEKSLSVADFHKADEIFLTGNASKTVPVTRFEDRNLPYGPVARRARELYWEFAHA